MKEVANAEAVLAFWFGSLDGDGKADPSQRKRWFTKDPAFDEEIKARFGATYDHCATVDPAGEMTAEERLAHIIVLDQLARNMFRGTAQMYAADAHALAHARALVPVLSSLPADHAAFALMPLMHAEEVAAQDECVALFSQMAKDEAWSAAAREGFAQNAKYAESHREVVVQYGRFPHRNGILGRASTAEEEAYLAKPGAGW